MKLINFILSLFFPEKCLSCGGDGEILCLKCAFSLPKAAKEEKGVLAALDYRDKRTRRAIWLFKYRNKRSLGKVFAVVLADMLTEELAEKAQMENFSGPVIVPMPVSRERLRERGYNQTEILAEELVSALGNRLEIEKDGLIKSVHTESQVKRQSKKGRLENLNGSFSVNPSKVAGRNIILLDDVITTGATMLEARKTLKKAGAKKILPVAVAHLISKYCLN